MSETKYRLAAIVAGSTLLLFASVGFAWLLSVGSASANVASAGQTR